MKVFVVAFAVWVGVAALSGAAPAFAQAAHDASWNGTWVGNWEDGNGTQIVFAGNDLIAFYRGGDYVSDAQVSPSKDDTVITVTWKSGQATLTRDGDAAKIIVREQGKKDLSFALKRDD